MSVCRRGFDEAKYITFSVKDELLRNKIKSQKKFTNTIDKEFNSDHVFNEKYLKAKIKPYNGKINTYLHSNKMQKEGSQ